MARQFVWLAAVGALACDAAGALGCCPHHRKKPHFPIGLHSAGSPQDLSWILSPPAPGVHHHASIKQQASTHARRLTKLITAFAAPAATAAATMSATSVT
jgi:hypothetical protein